jgi:DNA-binding NarL/FixJ family response regulator
MKRINVLIADDHPKVRESLASLLAVDPNIRVVGEAGDGLEAISLTQKFLPDVILMDIAMPKMNGIEAALAIHERWPSICVILITALSAETYREISRLCGAKAFLAKETIMSELLPTLYRTMNAS